MEDIEDVIETKIDLPRRFSGIYTNQGQQGTCYAHAISKVFSRVIKVIFSPLFISQTEKCDELYETENNDDIYADDDIWERCKDEILSSLLFLFCFNTSVGDNTKRLNGRIGGYTTYSYNAIVSILDILYNFYNFVLNDKLTKTHEFYKKLIIDRVLEGLNYKFLVYKMKHSLKELLNLEILKLCCILITFMILLKANVIQIRYIHLNPFDEEKLLDVLKKGFYAVLVTTNKNTHAMTIIDYIKYPGSTRIDLIVKNSHGKDFRGYDIVQKNGVIEDFKMTEKMNIYYIDPTINIDENRILEKFKEVKTKFKKVTARKNYDSDSDSDSDSYDSDSYNSDWFEIKSEIRISEPMPEPVPEPAPEPRRFSRTINRLRTLFRGRRGGKTKRKKNTKHKKPKNRKSKVLF